MPGLDDRAYLLGDHYRSPDKLQARIALHTRCSTNPHPWPRWVFEQLALPLAAHVLEVGCGTGTLWAANRDRWPPGLHVTLTDFSPGMVDATRAALGAANGTGCGGFAFAVADVQALPFADASFDTVVANHLLYHVPDRPRAYAELRRVLRPGGRFCAALNGRGHLRELWQLAEELAPTSARATRSPEPLLEEVLPLENAAAELAPFFEAVEVRWRSDGLRVTEVEPVLAYLASDWRFAHLPAAPLAAAIRRRLAASGGVWSIAKSSGVALARRGS